MADTFSSVASKVLKDSISTAMFIDDKVLEPFEENKEGFEDFSKLYKSFQKNNCLLDIRRYKNIGHKRKYSNSLSKIDLLVLDWQLVEDDTEYLIPLKMLDMAISSKNIHFSVFKLQQSRHNRQRWNNPLRHRRWFYNRLTLLF